MINRVLIRIKVVQTLYSYMLTEQTFMLESIPGVPTKEKRFAHQLYLETLTLFLDIAESVEKRGGQNPLADNRFIRMLAADEKIRSLRARHRIEKSPFVNSLPSFVSAVKDSIIYKNYLKDQNRGTSNDLKVWQQIFSTIIMTSPLFTASVNGIENYSMRGVERMRDIMAKTFMNFSSSQGYLSDAVKTLRHSLEKSRELYFRLLLLPIAITDMRDRQIDANRHKLLPTEEDLNPNLKFVENGFVALLREDAVINQYLEQKKISWLGEDAELVESLLEKILRSETYLQYMEDSGRSLQQDCDLWRNLYRKEILQDIDFLETLENKSVFWNDDIDIIGTFVSKTVRRFESARGEEPVLAMYKDEEDARFGEDLFRYVLKNKEEYRCMIDSYVNKAQWDSERLAFMDVVIMMSAIAELMEFPKIPVSVTINEYVEMAKSYSTAKSGAFINGILASIVTQLKEDGRIVKE